MVKSGISDHEIICVESMLSAVVLESNPRKVFLWNRADFVEINNKALEYCNNFVSQYTTNTPIEVLWASFKSFCLECLDLIPHKFHKMTDWDTYRNLRVIYKRNVVVHMTRMFLTCLAPPRVTIIKDFGPTLNQKGMSNVVCQLLNATIDYLQIM